MIINALTNTLVTSTYLILARVFGNGEVYSPRGWTITMIIYSVIFTIMLLVCYFGTYERASDVETKQDGKTEQKVSLKRSFGSLITNKYWLICIGTIVLGSLLQIGGFVSGADVQSASAVSMITNIFVWVPFIFAAFAAVILLFYNLDKLYPSIVADLKEGKYAPGVVADNIQINEKESI
jgi:Na+/melibiose symporter-like transporter